MIILIFFSLLWAGVSIFTYISLNQVNQTLQLLDTEQVNNSIINGNNVFFYQAVTRLERAANAAQAGNSQVAQSDMSAAAAYLDQVDQGVAKFKTIDHGMLDPILVDKIINASLQLRTLGLQSLLIAVKDNRLDDFKQGMNETYLPLRLQFSAVMKDYNSAIANNNSFSNSDIGQLMTRCQQVLLAAIVIGIIILFLTDRYLVNYLVKPLDAIKLHFRALSDGHLNFTIADMGRNCVGQLIPFLQEMQGKWVKTVSQIRGTAEMIYDGASEIAVGNNDLSARTEQQASALEQTAASMEQLSSTVKLNSDNAHQASKLAQTASQTAKKGGVIVDEVVATMGSIAASSKKIVEIIGVINGIAFQTNILALNAAVEAARAGEQGRGFAVVAGEVRSLAQRSGQAAKEIQTLIGESVERVQIGTKQVAHAGETMGEIVQSITHVTDIMGEIATASDEQSKGIIQIGQAVTEMDSVTQQNSAQVQESAAAAASLEQQARELTELVAVFQLQPVDGSPIRGRELSGELVSPGRARTQGAKPLGIDRGRTLNGETVAQNRTRAVTDKSSSQRRINVNEPAARERVYSPANGTNVQGKKRPPVKKPQTSSKEDHWQTF